MIANASMKRVLQETEGGKLEETEVETPTASVCEEETEEEESGQVSDARSAPKVREGSPSLQGRRRGPDEVD
jgi:hypothetical protein